MPRAPRRRAVRCAICTGSLAGQRRRYVEAVGESHTDCADDLERAIEDGGCRRQDYLAAFGLAMGQDAE